MKHSGKIALTAAILSLTLAVASCAPATGGRTEGGSIKQSYGSNTYSRNEDGQWNCDGSTTPGLGATN
jgi:hypothetical protein